MDLLQKVEPGLDYVRSLIMKVAEFIGNNISFPVENIYTILIVIISALIAKRILAFFYTTLEGRMSYWIISTGALFWIIKYLGA